MFLPWHAKTAIDPDQKAVVTNIAPNFAALTDAMAKGDRETINRLLARWLRDDVPVGDRWGMFASVLNRNGEISLSRAAIERYIAADPTDPKRLIDAAALIAAQGRASEAIALLDHPTAQLAPLSVIGHLRGALLSELGRFSEAERSFCTVLSRYPASGQTWLEYSAIHQFSSSDAQWAALSSAERVISKASPAAYAAYLFAKGKALDDQGDVPQAFAAFAAGAEIMAHENPYSHANDVMQVDAIIERFSKPFHIPAKSAHANRAIFVFGLPRSGTTLVEQILVAHPGIQGGGELHLFDIVVDAVGGPTAPKLHNSLSPSGLAQRNGLAALYDRLLSERFGSAGRIVDKTLNTSRALGVLVSVLEDVPLVWVRRDPLDTAWSCFHTFFRQGLPWSWRLESIARHFRNEDRLFEHWRDVLGDRLLVIPYEGLVTETEDWIERLCLHVDLPFDPAMTAPHRVSRPVATASVKQVRQPINARAVGSAQRYAAYLRPFIEAYT